MKGRVRLYIPDLCRDRGLSENAIGWLEQQQAVRNVRINYDCSSLVIDFDPKYEELFRNLFGRLRLITKNDLAAIISMGLSESPTRHEARELLNNNAGRIPNYPLTLPTLSLVMAFAANPWIRLINTPLILWNAYPIAVRAYDVWRKEKD